MNWQPVAKAPMQPDASVTFESNTYLVTDGHRVATCDFARGNGAGKPWADWSMYGGIGAGLITHWMPLPAAPGKESTAALNLEAAAKKLAELFDYPWEHMPAEGRQNMRKNVEAVLLAAAAKESP